MEEVEIVISLRERERERELSSFHWDGDELNHFKFFYAFFKMEILNLNIISFQSIRVGERCIKILFRRVDRRHDLRQWLITAMYIYIPLFLCNKNVSTLALMNQHYSTRQIYDTVMV